MKTLNKAAAITILSIGAVVAHTTASAQIGPDPANNARHSRIVGLWDAQVTVRTCAGGTPLFTFAGLHKFEAGGTGQIVPATDPRATSPHVMIWNYAGNDQYQMAFKMFRFDGSGTYVGWTVLTSELTLNPGANSYSGSGIAEMYDVAGNLVGASCPQIEAIRFTGE